MSDADPAAFPIRFFAAVVPPAQRHRIDRERHRRERGHGPVGERSPLLHQRSLRCGADGGGVGGVGRAEKSLGGDVQRDRLANRRTEQRRQGCGTGGFMAAVDIAPVAVEQMADIVEQGGSDQRQGRVPGDGEPSALGRVADLRHRLAVMGVAAGVVQRGDIGKAGKPDHWSSGRVAGAALPSRIAATVAVSARISVVRRRSL